MQTGRVTSNGQISQVPHDMIAQHPEIPSNCVDGLQGVGMS